MREQSFGAAFLASTLPVRILPTQLTPRSRGLLPPLTLSETKLHNKDQVFPFSFKGSSGDSRSPDYFESRLRDEIFCSVELGGVMPAGTRSLSGEQHKKGAASTSLSGGVSRTFRTG